MSNIKGLSGEVLRATMKYGSPSGLKSSEKNDDFLHILEDAKAQLDGGKDRDDELRQAAKELEALFVSQMVAAMRRTVPDSEGWFAKGSGEKLFQEMHDSELSKSMGTAKLGLAEKIYNQLAAGLEFKKKS